MWALGLIGLRVSSAATAGASSEESPHADEVRGPCQRRLGRRPMAAGQRPSARGAWRNRARA
eukprot:7275014-Lingulodinium_polyedra.AAC.1